MQYQPLHKFLLFYCLSIFYVISASAQPQNAGRTFAQKKSPFVFLENKGQIKDQHGRTREDIDFRISASGVNVFIGAGQIHYQWSKVAQDYSKLPVDQLLRLPTHNQGLPLDMYRMDVTLLGANKKATLISENKGTYFERYYLPECGPEGATAYSYEKFTYKEVYPGIDWVLYVINGQLEYDFILHPGAKVSDIRMQYGGATSLNIDEKGNLSSTTPFGSVVEQAPYSFQGDGKEVASEFVLKDNILSFNIPTPYEGVLTIDPKLVWATYYGDYCLMDLAFGVASAYKGKDIFFSGMTSCLTNIATTGAYQVSLLGYADAFLVKFNSAGTRLWGTYYGGKGNDGQGAKVVTDTFGNIYMAATTFSDSNIATPGSFQEKLAGGRSDDFLVKFDSSGKRLWATYYGGEAIEGVSLCLATDGYNVYLAGATSSASNIATPGSHQPIFGGNSDAYLVKFNGAGQRQWATYYGDIGNDMAYLHNGLACDKMGNIYISGTTSSTSGMATTGSYQVTHGGGDDAFLVKFDPSGKRIWGTYFGGSDNDQAYAVTCDDSVGVYIAGITKSVSQIATTNSHQDNFMGKQDIFLVKFNSSGKRQWSTYYGGTDDDAYPVVISNGNDKVFLSGSTSSTTHIASPGAWQSTFGGGSISILGDIFFTAFDASGVRQWGTYYGGSGVEGVNAALYDKDGYLYLAGSTASPGMATPGSHQDTLRTVIFMPLFAKFCVTAEGFAESSITGKDSICVNSEAVYTIPHMAEAEAYIWSLPPGWTGTSDSNSISITGGTTGGSIGVQIVRCGDTSSVRTYNVYVLPPDAPLINVNGFELGTMDAYSSYQWLLNGTPIAGATAPTYNVKENGDYSVITTNRWGCVDTSDAYPITNYTGIPDRAALAQSIRIYPNPASNRVHIQSPVPVSVVLSTVEGRELWRASRAKYVDIHSLSPGMYTLRFISEEGVLLKTEKLVKQD